MAIGQQLANLAKDVLTGNKRLFNFKAITAPKETTYKDRVFKKSGSGKPALTHNFIFEISDDTLVNGKPSQSGTDVSQLKYYYLDSIMAMPEVDLSFTFTIDNRDYTPLADFPKVNEIAVSYWDFDDFPHTSWLTDKYYKQLGASGLLIKGYKFTTITITDQFQTLIFKNCAITKPKSDSYNASLGMRVFSFKFVFSDVSTVPSSTDIYEKKLADIGSVGSAAITATTGAR